MPNKTTTLDGTPAGRGREERLAETFRLLADPGRMRMVIALHAEEELAVGELAAAAGLSQTACSQQLRLLRTARLVRRRRDGRHVYYSLFDDHVFELIELVERHLDEDH
ncbi:MAG: helix-turn-helix transcriptional regulator [Actinobacteria bacterium]|nr:helix-turn-helix transcriptional regulator [Actinomycetota bacterium]